MLALNLPLGANPSTVRDGFIPVSAEDNLSDLGVHLITVSAALSLPLETKLISRSY